MLSAVVVLCMSSCKDDDEDCSYSVATPEAVDLGLSVKWASFNLGATKPEEFGDYYMWGETTPATDRDCSWSTYKYANGAYNKLTKYSTDHGTNSHYSDNGFIDNKSVLDLEDDAAHVTLGGKFRMPTSTEWQELHDNCAWLWTQVNGVNGYLVTSKKKGFTDRSLFLPAAGARDGSDFSDQVSWGLYWSASIHWHYPFGGKAYYFNKSNNYLGSCERNVGCSVRPVSE